MQSRLVTLLALILLCPLGCGGGGGGDPGNPQLPFRFEWVGTVADIEDGSGAPAVLPDVNVGDTFVATLDYDPADFGDGVDVTSDGLDYDAAAALTMTFEFSSGGVYTREVNSVRARSASTLDQWNWKSDGSLVFQANDTTNSSYELPLPTSFPFMHTLFVNASDLLIPSSGNSLDLFVEAAPDDRRRISFGNQLYQVIEN